MTDKTQHLNAKTENDQILHGRRAALLAFGLAVAATSMAPALLTLSEAEARGRGDGKSGRDRGRNPDQRSTRGGRWGSYGMSDCKDDETTCKQY
jgi:hypothetical protein